MSGNRRGIRWANGKTDGKYNNPNIGAAEEGVERGVVIGNRRNRENRMRLPRSTAANRNTAELAAALSGVSLGLSPASSAPAPAPEAAPAAAESLGIVLPPALAENFHMSPLAPPAAPAPRRPKRSLENAENPNVKRNRFNTRKTRKGRKTRKSRRNSNHKI